MLLFCVKPFPPDNSPLAADKYKFQRLDSCIHEHVGPESPHHILSMLLVLQYKPVFWDPVLMIRSNPLILKIIVVKSWTKKNISKDSQAGVIFSFFQKVVYCRRAFEIKSWSKYNSLSLTLLWVNRQTGPLSPHGCEMQLFGESSNVTGWGRNVNYLGGFTRRCLFHFFCSVSLWTN